MKGNTKQGRQKRKTRKRKEKDWLAEERKYASLKFKPWNFPLRNLPTNSDFGFRMVDVRIAVGVLNLTKPELIDLVKALDEGKEFSEESGFMHALKNIASTQDVFEDLSKVLRNAEARLLVAASSVLVETSEGSQSPNAKKSKRREGKLRSLHSRFEAWFPFPSFSESHGGK